MTRPPARPDLERAPRGRTAQRLEWHFLPPHVRELIEGRCGSPVVDAASQGSGFTPGFASVLTCADGSRHFVKAAAAKGQRMFAHSYREEARKLASLPSSVPAPRLLWSYDEDWVVLGLEYVEAANPQRPWPADELDACLDALEETADLLTPPPPGLDEERIVDDFAAMPGHWGHLRETRPGLPHLDEAAELARGFLDVCDGSTLVHTDVRDDNVLIRGDGKALFCDWNWPAVGAAWIDTVFLMIGPRGDGTDVDALLASRRLTRDVPAEHVDMTLAMLVGYFLKTADDPVPAASPYLRTAQRWQGEVVWDWLCERRGWS
jgi:hypothetical protein